ncbi:DUF397 domain-containing protein [Streptomyces sp. WAC07061]|uniref:DUF397 domain-containing protein n=1 Tax=Streptomyces sp. WAC07061 TaxID=2487410 RepID=UPI000F7952FE|nr:DUF397 domain-containing protein [Streptomyces sp. WAC07061]RSS41019.1 DUF397 domain-containing protein [Streptomyces sp. WAC07061]
MTTESPRWRKSSYSDNGGNCVEVATNLPGAVPVRDSKAGDAGPVLTFGAPAFAAFLGAVRTP